MFDFYDAYLESRLLHSEEHEWKHWLAPGSDSLYAEDLTITKIAM